MCDVGVGYLADTRVSSATVTMPGEGRRRRQRGSPTSSPTHQGAQQQESPNQRPRTRHRQGDPQPAAAEQQQEAIGRRLRSRAVKNMGTVGENGADPAASVAQVVPPANGQSSLPENIIRSSCECAEL